MELEKAVNCMRMANPKPNLPALFARIDELAKQTAARHRPGVLHYLQKNSYEKGAALFCGGATRKTRLEIAGT